MRTFFACAMRAALLTLSNVCAALGFSFKVSGIEKFKVRLGFRYGMDSSTMLAWSVLTSTVSLLICQFMLVSFQRQELCVPTGTLLRLHDRQCLYKRPKFRERLFS